MNRLTHKYFAIICLTITLSCQSQILRSVKNISIFNNYAEESQLTQLTPFNKWIIVIINNDLNVATQMLKNLQDKNLDLSKTVVLELGDLATTEYLESHKELDPFMWVYAKDSNILSQLHIAGTPTIIGIQGDKIVWQVSGLHSKGDFNRTITRINSWSKNKEIRTKYHQNKVKSSRESG